MKRFYLFGLIILLLLVMTKNSFAYDVTNKYAVGGNINIWPTGGGSLLFLGFSGTYGISENIQGEAQVDRKSVV